MSTRPFAVELGHRDHESEWLFAAKTSGLLGSIEFPWKKY
jgi:hypothetical protein